MSYLIVDENQWNNYAKRAEVKPGCFKRVFEVSIKRGADFHEFRLEDDSDRYGVRLQLKLPNNNSLGTLEMTEVADAKV